MRRAVEEELRTQVAPRQEMPNLEDLFRPATGAGSPWGWGLASWELELLGDVTFSQDLERIFR